jgi:phospholipase/carboxylesterase
LQLNYPDEYYVISRAPYDLQYGSYAWYAINFDANQNKFSDNDKLFNHEIYRRI